jgi:hypothetical protein
VRDYYDKPTTVFNAFFKANTEDAVGVWVGNSVVSATGSMFVWNSSSTALVLK